ncbi:MAG: diaminopimelate dehydrogenase [Clostridia bacterium]|nr:diaminopimelate dehydrogenase [Clostridia bacterium]
MKKLKIGIVGFGNLGKAVLDVFKENTKIKIVAIFSKHLKEKSIENVPVYTPQESQKFKGKIDLMVLCTGSQTDMLKDAPFFAKDFNIINSFDTHKKIKEQLFILNKICKENNTFSLIACGWDPGIFSIFRAYFSLFCNKFAVFYGKGVSLGHTNAVKKVNGVIDAISITKPNIMEYKKAKSGEDCTSNLLKREVYVVSNANHETIKNRILKIKNYFEGEDVTIKFLSHQKLNELKTLAHKGEIIGHSKNGSFEEYNFNFKTSSNPFATAKIMLAFSLKLLNLKQKYGAGAYTPLSFSPLELLGKNEAMRVI